MQKNSIKTSLCSVPVESTDFKKRKNRSQGQCPILPKTAIVSLVEAMKKAGFPSSSFDFFDIDMLHPHLTDEDIGNYFSSYKPNVVGLSAVTSTSYLQIKRISSIIRSVLPDSWIVMGGNLAASSEAVLISTEVDLTVVGDGEIAWIKILEHIISYPDRKDYKSLSKLINIKGVAFLDEKGEINLNGFGIPIPEEEMPYPDYELLKSGLKDRPDLLINYLRPADAIGWFDFDDRAKDKNRGKYMASIYASKGCVAKCTFCQRSTKGYKVQPLEHLDNHLKYLKKNFDVGYILVSDENFGSDKKQAYGVADVFKKNDMLWMACGVRCVSTTDEDIKYYKDRGCSTLKYGIETGSQKMLDLMEKVFKVEDSIKTLTACHRHGIHSPINIMVGMPGEDENTTKDTGKFLGKIAAMIGIHPLLLQCETSYALPLPGTPLWEYGEQIGVIGKENKDIINYLTRVADVGTYKRYYINLNGAPISEVLFWEYIVKLESSRTFRKEISSSNINKKLTRKYIEQYKKIKVGNPNQSLKYTALKFTIISYLIDNFIVGRKFADFLPRAIVYPVVKYLIYFEYLIQKMFKSNRKNNIFMKTKKVARVDFESVANEKSLKKKSLRGFVAKNRIPLENSNILEKVRQSLRAGL
jgi:radical SAM superfamily enzyme YgiQ (UPF0313 family)